MGVRDPGTIAEVEQVLVERILSLDASAYTHPYGTPAEWHQSTIAFDAAQENNALSHLAFDLHVEAARNAANERGAVTNGYLWVSCDVVVAFVFQLRPSEQIHDARRASDAAVDVVRALMTDWSAQDPCVQVDIPPGEEWYRTAATPDGGWALVIQRFSASFELRLDPTPTTVPPVAP